MVTFSEVCNLAIEQLNLKINKLENEKYIKKGMWSTTHGFIDYRDKKIEEYNIEIERMNKQINDINNKNIVVVMSCFKDAEEKIRNCNEGISWTKLGYIRALEDTKDRFNELWQEHMEEDDA